MSTPSCPGDYARRAQDFQALAAIWRETPGAEASDHRAVLAELSF